MPQFGKRRALGQHFLKDTGVIQGIVDAAFSELEKTPCPTLLEIGPGRGAITLPILMRLPTQPAVKRMILAERDRELAAHWRQNSSVVVKEGDFLELPDTDWADEAPIAVVSNLPYSAGTAIFTRLAAQPGKIPFMVLMFQAEVAQRLRAQVSTKAWGSLSIWTQNHWDVEKLLSVPPGAFAPPPDVNSEVVLLRRRAKPRVETPDVARWDKLLRAAFAHRRKMLRSGLPPEWRKALDASGVDGTKRAEALSWEEWQKLYQGSLSP